MSDDTVDALRESARVYIFCNTRRECSYFLYATQSPAPKDTRARHFIVNELTHAASGFNYEH